MKEVFIVAAKRTPIGGFLGNLSNFTATELGALAIREAYLSAKIDPSKIDSVYMGNVLSSNLGQSPARQASLFAGISNHADCTTINKVCAAGMKAVIFGSQQIQLGLDDLVMTGGMESMSNAPHYSLLRKQVKLGNEIFIDGLLKDGLTDVYSAVHMGNIAEMTVEKYALSRATQDEYALNSYSKSMAATNLGKFKNEIFPINVKGKKEDVIIDADEDIYKIIPEKVSKLKPSFDEKGTITAANASNLSDGAAAILLASKDYIDKFNLTPLAKIIAYADGALSPEEYGEAPSKAIKKVLERANLDLSEIDFLEINEAYSAVVLVNQKILNLDLNKINVYGGAVSMGHPLGASGARIICTLVSVLQQEGGKYGLAAICNGGGGSSAVIIENLKM